MRLMSLTAYQDQLAITLSDGIKKILKLAISLIGDFSLVYIDDLSSELDPINKYLIHDLICSNEKVGSKPMMFYSRNIEECLLFSSNFVFDIRNEDGKFKLFERIKYDYEGYYNCEYAVNLPNRIDIDNYLNQNNENFGNFSSEHLKIEIYSELSVFEFVTNEGKELIIFSMLIKNNKQLNEEKFEKEEERLKMLYLKLLITLKQGKKLIENAYPENKIYWKNLKLENGKFHLSCSLMIFEQHFNRLIKPILEAVL